jgi:hypothetical protein
MNWNVAKKKCTTLLVIWAIICCNSLDVAGINLGLYADSIRTNINESSKEYVIKPGKKSIKIQAIYNGFITVESDNRDTQLGLVTVFSSDYKTILTQTISQDGHRITFLSKEGESYYITWQQECESDIQWRINQLEENGICFDNAIAAIEGVMEVNHNEGYDKWFVYKAERTGSVVFSSYGYTTENTCLFLYDESAENILGSSNFTKGSLQSEYVIDVKEGELYYVKWSSAFTTGRYNWKLAYL